MAAFALRSHALGPQTVARIETSRALQLFSGKAWCPGAELNHRHADFQSAALPTELPGRIGSVSTPILDRRRYRRKRVGYSMGFLPVQRFKHHSSAKQAVRTQTRKREKQGQAAQELLRRIMALTGISDGKRHVARDGATKWPADPANAPSIHLAGLVSFFTIIVLFGPTGDDVGAREPAVEVDILAACRAEGIGFARRWPTAFGAGPLWPQRRDISASVHDQTRPADQFACILYPSPASRLQVS